MPGAGATATLEATKMQLLCTLFLAVALHVVSGLSIPVKGGLLDSGQYITHFTNTWAVEVHGGQEAANGIAEKYGFVNLGQVRGE